MWYKVIRKGETSCMIILSDKFRTISDVEKVLNGGFIRESRTFNPFKGETISGKLYFGEKPDESVRVRALYRGNTGIIISPEETGDEGYEKLNKALEQAERSDQTGYHQVLTGRAMLLTTEMLMHLIFWGLALYALSTYHDIDSRPIISILTATTYASINIVIRKITTVALKGKYN